jgi:hypothetical protein
MAFSAETEWPILLQHGKPRLLAVLRGSQQNLRSIWYAIIAAKSRVFQGFETLSAIPFQTNRIRCKVHR